MKKRILLELLARSEAAAPGGGDGGSGGAGVVLPAYAELEEYAEDRLRREEEGAGALVASAAASPLGSHGDKGGASVEGTRHGGSEGGGEGGGGGGGAPAPAGRRFVLLEKVRAPVSWDAGHVFWVWRCESVPDRVLLLAPEEARENK